MARSRNIKPGFFCNEVLAEMDFATRLLFIGLWTEADRDGKLEDRPKKIKMAIFPADNVDVDKMLTTLHNGNLITRYSVNGICLIKINKWAKHQSPHHTEKKSILPDNVESKYDNATLTVKKQESDGGNPPDSLIPDSLIPDSLKKDIVDSGESPVVQNDFLQDEFDRFWRNYPLKKAKQPAKKAFLKLLKGKTIGKVKFNVDMILSYHFDCIERGDIGADKLHAATLLNQKRWEDNPDFIEQFKQDWIKENASGKPE